MAKNFNEGQSTPDADEAFYPGQADNYASAHYLGDIPPLGPISLRDPSDTWSLIEDKTSTELRRRPVLDAVRGVALGFVALIKNTEASNASRPQNTQQRRMPISIRWDLPSEY